MCGMVLCLGCCLLLLLLLFIVVVVVVVLQVLGETNYKNIVPLFKGCTVVACSKDSTRMSDLISATRSENKLRLLGGVLDGQMLTPQDFQRCAQLPSLFTQYCILSKSLTQLQFSLGNSLSSSQQRLCYLIKNLPK